MKTFYYPGKYFIITLLGFIPICILIFRDTHSWSVTFGIYVALSISAYVLVLLNKFVHQLMITRSNQEVILKTVEESLRKSKEVIELDSKLNHQFAEINLKIMQNEFHPEKLKTNK